MKDARIAITQRAGGGAPTVLERRWRYVRLTLWTAAAMALGLACALHPSLARQYLSEDGQLAAATQRLLLGMQIVLLLVATALAAVARRFRQHTPGRERLVLGTAVGTGAVVVSLLLTEAGLRAASNVLPLRAERHFFFVYDAYLGWRHRPGAVAVFKNTLVRINAEGLRDVEIPRPARSSDHRILFLGDSQLFGDGVAAEDTFVERLEREFQSVQAINAGVIGYGTDQQLLYFERQGESYNPKVTVVALNSYDLRDNISDRVRSGYRKPRFEIANPGELRLRNVPIPQGSVVDRLQRELRSRSYVYTLTGTLFGNRRNRVADRTEESSAQVFPPDGQFNRALGVTSGVLERLAMRVKRSGGRLVVAFLPYEMDYHGDARYSAQTDRLVRSLEQDGVTAGFLVFDLRSYLTPGRGLYLDRMHFNAEGHSRMASALKILFVEHGLIPDRQARD